MVLLFFSCRATSVCKTRSFQNLMNRASCIFCFVDVSDGLERYMVFLFLNPDKEIFIPNQSQMLSLGLYSIFFDFTQLTFLISPQFPFKILILLCPKFYPRWFLSNVSFIKTKVRLIFHLIFKMFYFLLETLAVFISYGLQQ